MLSKFAYLTLCRSIPLFGAAGPRRCRQGPGDPGARSPAAPPNQTTQARSCRPGGACRHQPRLAPSPLVVLLCQARDAAALSPAPGPTRTAEPGDLRSTRSCSSSSSAWPGRTHAGATDASRASCSGLGCTSRPPRSAPRCAATDWIRRRDRRPPPASVRASAGCWDRRLRLLHRRHRLAAAALHLVLHRTRHSPGPPGRVTANPNAAWPPSRLATSCCAWRTKHDAARASSSAIVTRSSAVGSTRCSARRAPTCW